MYVLRLLRMNAYHAALHTTLPRFTQSERARAHKPTWMGRSPMLVTLSESVALPLLISSSSPSGVSTSPRTMLVSDSPNTSRSGTGKKDPWKQPPRSEKRRGGRGGGGRGGAVFMIFVHKQRFFALKSLMGFPLEAGCFYRQVLTLDAAQDNSDETGAGVGRRSQGFYCSNPFPTGK